MLFGSTVIALKTDTVVIFCFDFRMPYIIWIRITYVNANSLRLLLVTKDNKPLLIELKTDVSITDTKNYYGDELKSVL